MPILDLEVQSEALASNPWGDPSVRRLPVVLPEAFDPSQSIPVVWWLSGYAGVGRNMLTGDGWQEGLEARLLRLRKEGRIGLIAVALPDAFTRLGGSQYLSSPAVGDYERYLWVELRARLAKEISIASEGVAGKSSGGFGALMAAMRNPGRFRAAVCHSGDMAFELSLFPDIPLLMNALRDYGSVEALLDAHQKSENRKAGRWFGPLSMLAMAAVYSPSEDHPLGIELPFDLDTAELKRDVLERWRAHDPIEVVRRRPEARDALAQLDLLFIDCGLDDEHHLHWGAHRLARTLRQFGIEHEHETFKGGHRATQHRLDVSLPKLYAALSR